MNELGHGANVDYMAHKYNKNPNDILDFSSNINPYMISNLEKYLIEGLNECSKYPDINYTNLRKNIGDYLNIDPNHIIPGNGATEIIYLLMKSIKGRIGIINPTFSEYERGAKLNNLDVLDLYFNKEDSFSIDIDSIQSNINNIDALFICNPNNPTGIAQTVDELMDLCIKHNKLLIVDETFIEFVKEEKKYSLLKYIEKTENLIIIKAITKFFGMPGIRLGYGVTSNKNLLEKMYRYKEPWTINTFADILSNHIFKDEEYIVKSKQYFENERRYMISELKTMNNIKTYDTDGNFILIKLNNIKSDEIREKLFINNDILVRDASNFKGLDNSFIRIAIKDNTSNAKIIQSLKDILGG